jgi:hypothetical protein
MNWYLVKLVFRIICGDGQHNPQFDEQLRLIGASNEEDAFEKANSIGLREQEEFFSERQTLVQWKYINVAELYKLSAQLDGAELYSRVQETDNANLYIDLINKKAAHIRQNNTHKLLELI